jgi:Na+-transporting NADH:ubiquinone oxidoreductase subunit A
MSDAKGLPMKSFYLKKGYNLNLAGAPSRTLEKLPQPKRVALLPEHLPFIKPRLQVNVGDHVAVGAPLIEDKRNSAIQVLSPGGGQIEDIQFGPRRVIQSIVVALDSTEQWVEFESYSEKDIEQLSRETLVQAIVNGGLWPLIRALPFRDYAPLDAPPADIYVVAGHTEPFHPSPSVYLRDREAVFRYGLTALRRLSANRVHVCVAATDEQCQDILGPSTNLQYTGPYPVHDPGVLVYGTKKSADMNHAWYITAQDVLLLAQLLIEGRYPTERIVSVAGPGVDNPRHLLTRLGAPLNEMTPGSPPLDHDSYRFIVGGVLTGYTGHAKSYLGMMQTAINLLPEGNHKGELLGLFRPGYRKPTFSRAFLSAVNRASLEMDCNFHGGERACIACGYCTRVCPVDILPQFTYKALLVGEVEEALAHGLLDCAECGLCSYVCPSKLELYKTFKQAKADYHREQERQ